MRNPEIKIEHRDCRFKKQRVSIVLQAIKELGNPEPLDWSEISCSGMDDDCDLFKCKFADDGDEEPF